ncbi:hypothetical protein [Streptomyces yerevanensis]|uniref:hypothetical protein n=1 Tax=Streptomyces yerevanensis TaxID=66378 RepID=UPI000525F86E|nr:hypothetical protein [Streptomyces yerevanensis]
MAEKPSGEPRGSEDPKDFADDVWEKFVRDSELGIGTSDAPKEPSARARMVTERLRQQDARGEVPPGWRTGPDLQGMGGRPARRRKIWAIIGVPVVLVLALVAMKPSLLPGDPFGTGGTGAESAAPLPEETAPPSTAPSAAPGTPTLDQPFAGSPAARYADGATGIVLPEAKPVGSFGKDEVDRALKQTKALLVDANLDRKTLLGGTPETVFGILDLKQPQMLSDVRSWLRKPDKENDPLLLFSRFDKDEVRLVGDVVKTHGRMTFEPGEDGSVVVHADYTFVYAVAPADPDSTEVARVIMRRILETELSDPARVQVTPGKLAVARFEQDLANSACDVHDGYIHPQFDSDINQGPAPTGPTVDPYDRSRDIRNSDTCGTVSRT